MAMDLSYVLGFLALPLLAAIVSTILLMHVEKRRKKHPLPPGAMGLPWIGETMEFYKAQKKNRLFEEFFEPRVTAYGTMFKTRLMGSPTVVVNGAEANRFFLSNEFKLVVSSWPSASVQLMGTDSIMEKQGEQHRCIRGIIATSLSYNGLEALVPKICDSVQAHLEMNWHGKDTIALFRSAKILTFTVVFKCLFGIKVGPGTLQIFENILEGVFALPVRFPGSKFSRAKKARGEIEKMLVDIVREKCKEMETECKMEEEEGMLLQRLVAALISGEISEKEVVDNVVLLVFAAHDTTSFAIAMVFRMLAQHPQCYSQLLQEHVDIISNKRGENHLALEDVKKMKYTWQVVCESIRLFPPIFGSFRKAITDIQYEGFIIPKGWKVLWTAYGTHYNEEYFQDPLRFNPNRFEEPAPPYVFVPFGGGARACAGYQLAKINILIFVHYVVKNYDWSIINLDEPITMDPLPFPSQGMPIKISSKHL